MIIRNAELKDLEQILVIYANARAFMRAHDNPNQWNKGDYPDKELLTYDIEVRRLFVATDDKDTEILAVWAYILGKDPSYGVIESGAWLNDEPYGTIHRLASSGKVKRITAYIFDWALSICDNLRGDTHADNYVMQSSAEDFGFKMCGIIHLASETGEYNGDPRIAYHVTRKLREQRLAENKINTNESPISKKYCMILL